MHFCVFGNILQGSGLLSISLDSFPIISTLTECFPVSSPLLLSPLLFAYLCSSSPASPLSVSSHFFLVSHLLLPSSASSPLNSYPPVSSPLLSSPLLSTPVHSSLFVCPLIWSLVYSFVCFCLLFSHLHFFFLTASFVFYVLLPSLLFLSCLLCISLCNFQNNFPVSSHPPFPVIQLASVGVC